MEQEIEEIRQKYQSKRQPILDAIEAKKRRQQNFWATATTSFHPNNQPLASVTTEQIDFYWNMLAK